MGWVDSVPKALQNESQVTLLHTRLLKDSLQDLKDYRTWWTWPSSFSKSHLTFAALDLPASTFCGISFSSKMLFRWSLIEKRSIKSINSLITGTRTSVKGQSLRVTSLASFWYLINVRRVAFALRSVGALEACMPSGGSGTLDYPWQSLRLERCCRFYFCHSILFKLLCRPFSGLKSLHNPRTHDLSRNMVNRHSKD